MFYIQEIVWEEGRVTVVHNGPFKSFKKANKILKSITKNPNTDYEIVQKENR